MQKETKIAIVLLIILSIFGVTYLLDIEPKEYSEYSNNGILLDSYKYVNDLESQFYYQHLNDNEKLYYQSMYNASINSEDYFNVISIPDTDEVSNARYAFISDWPEYFWWQGDCQIETNFVNNLIGMDYPVYKIYITDSKEYDKSVATKNINELVDYIINECSAEYQYDFIYNLHNFLVLYLDYDETGNLSHNVGGSLFEQKAVCDGYARAFKLIANRAGYDCLVVYGDSTNSEVTESHAWNLIKLGDNWFHVDVTWDDLKDEDGNQLDISYEYFLLNDEYISIDHEADSNYNYPKCSDMSLYYYNMSGYYSDHYDKNEITYFILYGLNNGVSCFNIKFLNYDDGYNAYNWLLNNQGFANIFNMYRTYYNISYSIGFSETSNLLKISYKYK